MNIAFFLFIGFLGFCSFKSDKKFVEQPAIEEMTEQEMQEVLKAIGISMEDLRSLDLCRSTMTYNNSKCFWKLDKE